MRILIAEDERITRRSLERALRRWGHDVVAAEDGAAAWEEFQRQQFDIVTMLGFIILIGTVVNNAILIVHQALNNIRFYGFEGQAAIIESVKTRIRPIFMSATTSVFALLPLAVSTGQGSELYRGLGSVILGGLAISTVFTLFIIPALLAFFIHREKGRQPEETATSSA